MRRRDLLLGCLASLALSGGPKRNEAMAASPTPEEIQHNIQEFHAKALAEFPFARVQTSGADALATWERLKGDKRGTPVIIGDDDDLVGLMEIYDFYEGRSAAAILDAAQSLRFPEDLVRKRAEDDASALEWIKQLLAQKPNAPLPTIIQQDDKTGQQHVLSREEAVTEMLRQWQPPVGEWPGDVPDYGPEPTIAYDHHSGGPLEKVNIAFIPTNDWTAIPAFLRWGGWNECPLPEYHIAAFRSWRDRFGAELVAFNHDTLNLRVQHGPSTREAALDLAREQYVYCSDIVDQWDGKLSSLAATLLGAPWWHFWWD
jgi:hypothetical protein